MLKNVQDARYTLTSSTCKPNALAAASKGMPAAKLCINKILQFLTAGDAGCRLTCVMAVKRQ